jgi:hypothetical protein
VRASEKATKEKERADSATLAEAKRYKDFLRLADLQELDDLTGEVDSLWPLLPSGTDALERWLERARRLHAALPEHEQTLALMEASTLGEDRWLKSQLVKLIAGTEALDDPETGLITGLSPEHGWGIQKRLDFARSIRERSMDGAEAAERWREAVASIRDRGECPLYDGLELKPQLGLLPIGRNPDSVPVHGPSGMSAGVGWPRSDATETCSR